jgi:outer membrane protein
MKFALVALSFALLAAPMANAIVIGKVDVQKVLVEVKEGKKVRDKLKAEFDKKQKILRKEEERIKKMKKDLDKQAAILNDQARSKKEKELQEEIFKIQQKSMSFQREIQGKENKLKAPILEKIRKIVTSVSKKMKLDVTFESSTAPVIYAKEEKDITKDVIKAYNKKHK